ncbi:MAG: flagellar basal-body rod protein FlgG [Legionellales bacterium]
MDLALWVAKSGLEAHHKNIAVISNNLANASTPGFKKNRPEFEDLAYQVITQPGSSSTDQTLIPAGILLGTGVRLADNKKIFTQGPAQQTDNALDLSIQGRGFLQIQVPNDSTFAYTRTGSLQLNDQGQLVLHNGYIVQPPVTVPPGIKNISISKDGIVSVINNANVSEQIGQLQVADFMNPTGLEAIGENLYRETLSSGSPVVGTPTIDGLGAIHQNELEASNVNVVEEMVNLIEAQRAFEMTSKVVSAIDNMYQKLDRET